MTLAASISHNPVIAVLRAKLTEAESQAAKARADVAFSQNEMRRWEKIANEFRDAIALVEAGGRDG